MSVATGSNQAAFCATFIDELVRSGVTDAVVSPGSRSTPLALAIAASGLRMHVRLDERSACFVALGLARESQRPVLVLVTSGTAAAELLAGVVEAHLDRVPLIVATADRPPELHGIGAAQTIVQQGLFGHHVLSAVDPGPVHALPHSSWRPIASRLVRDATAGLHAGPVVINLPLVEPLVAEPGAMPPGRLDGKPWFFAASSEGPSSTSPLALSGKGVIVAGRGAGSPALVLAAARRLGWPLLADPRSGAAVADPTVVTMADTIVRDRGLADALRPETILLAGAPPASKVMAGWIEAAALAGSHVVLVGDDALRQHPSQLAAEVVAGSPDRAWPRLTGGASPADPSWLAAWSSAQEAIDGVYTKELSAPAWSEPAVLRMIGQAEDIATIVVSSSMPVRDLEWFGGTRVRPPVVHANRGANGIDGVVSTAIGVALACSDPVVAVVGDLAFLHDVSALVEGVDDSEGSLTILVLDNGGGGIFSFLPQRAAVEPETFAQLFTTRRSPRPDQVAAGFGIASQVVSELADLRTALDGALAARGVHVIVCDLPDHDANVATHAALMESGMQAARAVVPV